VDQLRFDADPDPTPSFTYFGEKKFAFLIFTHQCQFIMFDLSIFGSILQHTEKSIVYFTYG
jgi:hypothetical protein